MAVRFTGSARSVLLDALVTVRDRDRSEAGRLVDSLETTVAELARDPEIGVEVASGSGRGFGGDGLRLLYRVRDGDVWVVAVWPTGSGGET